MRRASGRETRVPEGYSQEFYSLAAQHDTEKDFSPGLSIVMRLCCSLTQRVRTDSRPGCGTVFRIDLEPHEGWSGSVSERQDSFPVS